MSLPDQPARNPALEAAIRANRDDPAPYHVYGDFLQSRGNPLGELLILDGREPERAAEIIKGLGLPAEDLATFGWRRGLLQWLRLENNRDWMDDKFDALGLVRPLFSSIACCALEDLRIGVLRWESNDEDVPAVLAEAANHEWARDLMRLHLGDVDPDSVDIAMHCIGDVGGLVTDGFPNLRFLRFHSGEYDDEEHKFGVAGLALPELRELVVETNVMRTSRLEALLAAELPRLERLELWFGAEEYGADATIDDLEPLLSGDVFPTVRHLALRNCEFANDIARALPSSAIASRLESLDLSMGTLEDDAAIVLADQANVFSRLKKLSVDDSFLTATSLEPLRAKWRDALVSEEQKDTDDDYRYVSVSE
jgi:uncharacterized protein (TIGR02996 family)